MDAGTFGYFEITSFPRYHILGTCVKPFVLLAVRRRRRRGRRGRRGQGQGLKKIKKRNGWLMIEQKEEEEEKERRRDNR